jgi:hypothetical protein
MDKLLEQDTQKNILKWAMRNNLLLGKKALEGLTDIIIKIRSKK